MPVFLSQQSKIMDLPNCKKPCANCPFRKDVTPGWLGSERMEEILAQGSFTCHKTNRELQCAGHMLMKGEENDFVQLANRLKIPIKLSGENLVFETETDCINHHNFNNYGKD